MEPIKTTFYKLPLQFIPFSKIPTLNGLNYQYAYCSSFPLITFMTLDAHMVTVYNSFDNEIKDLDELQNKELLFGSVVSEKLSTRGKAKCIVIGTKEGSLIKEDLPHLKYSSNNNNELEGNWFYMEHGKYFILNGVASKFENVKHLEGIALYGDAVLRLRIVIELLKINVNKHGLTFSMQDYKDIAYKVFKADPVFLKTDDNLIKDGINSWIPGMVLTPSYVDIPKEIRGRAIR
ncbi:hypothetical protein GCM10023149_44150 [Mucilaginibacter gynuensis]|uniref:Uncharacterized protein n=1 Tax=Mucilaginibacter gynuensis TaxID=1302236 RepID=A0ABP8H951_9SPHI